MDVHLGANPDGVRVIMAARATGVWLGLGSQIGWAGALAMGSSGCFLVGLSTKRQRMPT